jgi:DNA-binding response OmpR family regulator
MLPGRDGLSVLRILRQRSNAVPVIVLTALAARKETLA